MNKKLGFLALEFSINREDETNRSMGGNITRQVLKWIGKYEDIICSIRPLGSGAFGWVCVNFQ